MYVNIHISITCNSPKPKWPAVDKEINKLWYIYTLEYYSETSKNEVNYTWRDPVNFTNMLSERSQPQYDPVSFTNMLSEKVNHNKTIFSMIPFIWNSRNDRKISGCLGPWLEGVGTNPKGKLSEWVNSLYLDCGGLLLGHKEQLTFPWTQASVPFCFFFSA